MKGSATFAPPQSVVDYLGTQPRGRGDVAVRFPGVAAGVIQVQKHGEKYSTPDELQAIDVQHPALAPLSSIHLAPLLAVEITNSVVTGYVTVSAGKKPVRSPQELIAQIRSYPTALGLLGLGDVRTPAVENKLSGGALSLKTDLTFKLGGYLDGTGSFGLADDVVTFAAHAHASVRDVAELVLDIERKPDGVIAGRAEIPVKLKNFSGNFVLMLAGGVLDVIGTFRYTTEKLSGEVTLLITDAQTARNVAYQHLPPEAIDASAREAAGGSTVAAAPTSAGPKPGPRAVAGWGTLDVHYSDWLTGKALVVIDGKGFVTVVGKIAPPGKVEFPQTKLDYERKIFGLEVRASYGLPYVGNVFLFAGVSLFAIAKISPLTLSKIEIDGRYSTDPTIFNSFSLSANLSISALAAARLRAEGGVGIEILDHDIKIGAALTATAGIRGYVDATPVIGYRELADPQAGRRGEFYIHGEAEFAAQAFLAMGGELFVKLDTPWWSPVSDHTWTWPLGQLVYPLPGEIGFGADIDYIFGSGKLPTISPKKVDFNADRFMSDLMDDNVPHGSPTEQKKPGRWNERQQAPPVAPAPPQAKDTKGPGKKRDDKPTKDKAKTWAGGMAAIGQLKKRGDTQPYGAAEIDAALKAIKTQYGFSVLQAKAAGDQWEIAATLGKDTLKKPLRIKRAPGAAVTPGAPAARRPSPGAAPGPDARTPAEKTAAVEAAVRDAQALLSAAGATPVTVRAALPGLITKFRLTQAILEAVGADEYDVAVEINPRAKTPTKKFDPTTVKTGDTIRVQFQTQKSARDTWPESRAVSAGIKYNYVPASVTSVQGSQIHYRTRADLTQGAPVSGFVEVTGYDVTWKRYQPGSAYVQGPAFDRIKSLNKWDDVNDARQVLNWRYHNSFETPPNMEWEHIVEQSAVEVHAAIALHSVDNIALATRTLNQAFGRFFGQEQEGTNRLPLRVWLRDKPLSLHLFWKERCYGIYQVRVVRKSVGIDRVARGDYQVIQ